METSTTEKNLNRLELADLLTIDTTTLRQRQADALKQHVIEKLEKVINLVKLGQLDKIEKETAYSPAGDGYGSDTCFINFGISELGEEWEYLDIVEVCNKIKALEGPLPERSELED